MIILITGATGYIGREFIRKYQNEFDIIALVREKSNIADIEQFNCKIIKFNDFTDINLIFQKKHHIWNSAFCIKCYSRT